MQINNWLTFLNMHAYASDQDQRILRYNIFFIFIYKFYDSFLINLLHYQNWLYTTHIIIKCLLFVIF